MYWVGALAALSFLIIVHEAGHYFVARWFGMRVERFSIGFGPKIWGRRNKHGTMFQVAPILFGGFVEIKGMALAEEVDPDDKDAYPNKPVWQRFLAIFAGPATNYLSAIVLALALYSCAGMRSYERWYAVDETSAGFDAHGKLQPGDQIMALDGQPLFMRAPDGKVTSLLTEVNKRNGNPVVFTIKREGTTLDIPLTPKLDKDKDGKPVYRVGIAMREHAERVNPGFAKVVGAAFTYPIETTKIITTGLWEVVTGKAELDAGGPVRITQEFKRAFEEGFIRGVELLMALSVYLGLFNLFPLPALDGGRLVFLGYEMITRRRANPRIESTVHLVGVLLLIVLMVIITVGDIRG